MTLRIAILFSGGGTTLQNLVEATRDGRLPGVEVVKAIASRPDAGGVARCDAAGVPCVVVPKAGHPDDADHSAAVFSHLGPNHIDLICMAGWTCKLELITPWIDRRVMNVHPSLLPAFGGRGMYGRFVHDAVLQRGCKVSGCTVHYADNGLDTGPILEQRCVPVEPGDTPATLAARVAAAEREAYVRAVLRHIETTLDRSAALPSSGR